MRQEFLLGSMAIAMFVCVAFIHQQNQRVDAAPANVAAGFPRLSWEPAEHTNRLAVKNAEIEAEIVRLGGQVPGGVPAIDRSIAALARARADLAAASPQNADALAQTDRNIHALERAKERLVHSRAKERTPKLP
jgi:hypothetical protein